VDKPEPATEEALLHRIPYHRATKFALQIAMLEPLLIRRETSRVLSLMCPFCVRLS
jgi:hypothetical protein